jgi:hypothetical protein
LGRAGGLGSKVGAVLLFGKLGEDTETGIDGGKF